MKYFKIFISLSFIIINLNGFAQSSIEYHQLGIEKGQNQDYQGAIFYFTKAIELNQNYSLAFYNRGFAKYRLKDFENSLIDFNKAIELNTDYADAYYYRAIVKKFLLFLEKGYDNGCSDFYKAYQLGNDNAYDAIIKFCK